jgi:hypothetical protein
VTGDYNIREVSHYTKLTKNSSAHAMQQTFLEANSVKNYCIYGTQNFITVFTGSSQRSLNWVNQISLRYILILSSHLHLCFWVVSVPQRFPTRLCMPFPISPIRAACPAHLTLLDLFILIFFVKSKYSGVHSFEIFYRLMPLIPIRPKYCMKHPIYPPPPVCVRTSTWQTSSTPIQNIKQNISFVSRDLGL